MRLNFPKAPMKNPETAAEEFCREIRALFYQLQSAIWHPELIKIARRRIHELRDIYHRARGNGFVSRRVGFADRVCAKAAEIMNRNPGDWNAHRAGQQFWQLDKWLLEFEVEPYRARQQPRQMSNVVFLHVDGRHRTGQMDVLSETDNIDRV